MTGGILSEILRTFCSRPTETRGKALARIVATAGTEAGQPPGEECQGLGGVGGRCVKPALSPSLLTMLVAERVEQAAKEHDIGVALTRAGPASKDRCFGIASDEVWTSLTNTFKGLNVARIVRCQWRRGWAWRC